MQSLNSDNLTASSANVRRRSPDRSGCKSRLTLRLLKSHNNFPLKVALGVCTLWILFAAPRPLIYQTHAADNTGKNEANSLHYLIEGAYYLLDENQPERAVPYLKRAIELNPNLPDAYYFLGQCYYRLEISLPHVLFYLHEAEKRGVVHDRFRPDLLEDIQKQYPDIQPSATQDEVSVMEVPLPKRTALASPMVTLQPREAQVIVEGEDIRGGTISVQSPDGTIQKFKLGEPIPLAEGERYTIHFTSKHKRQLFKRLVLISSVIAVWMLR